MIIEITLSSIIYTLLIITCVIVGLSAMLYAFSFHEDYPKIKRELIKYLMRKVKDTMMKWSGADNTFTMGANLLDGVLNMVANQSKPVDNSQISVKREGHMIVLKFPIDNEIVTYHVPFSRRNKRDTIIYKRTESGDLLSLDHHPCLPFLVKPKHLHGVTSIIVRNDSMEYMKEYKVDDEDIDIHLP